MNKYVYFGLLIMVLGIIAQMIVIKKQAQKIAIQKTNITTLQVGIKKFKTKDSTWAAQVGVLIQSKEDLKKYNTDITKQLETMDISIRKLKTAIKTSTVTKFNNITNIKDSLVIVSDTVTIYISKYKDQWMNFYHKTRNGITDSLNVDVKANLYHGVYWDRKGFWPVRFLKRKKYYLRTKSDNPYITIDSLKMIDVSRY